MKRIYLQCMLMQLLMEVRHNGKFLKKLIKILLNDEIQVILFLLL